VFLKTDMTACNMLKCIRGDHHQQQFAAQLATGRDGVVLFCSLWENFKAFEQLSLTSDVHVHKGEARLGMAAAEYKSWARRRNLTVLCMLVPTLLSQQLAVDRKSSHGLLVMQPPRLFANLQQPVVNPMP
jgi:hypothetical protein